MAACCHLTQRLCGSQRVAVLLTRLPTFSGGCCTRCQCAIDTPLRSRVALESPAQLVWVNLLCRPSAAPKLRSGTSGSPQQRRQRRAKCQGPGAEVAPAAAGIQGLAQPQPGTDQLAGTDGIAEDGLNGKTSGRDAAAAAAPPAAALPAEHPPAEAAPIQHPPQPDLPGAPLGTEDLRRFMQQRGIAGAIVPALNGTPLPAGCCEVKSLVFLADGRPLVSGHVPARVWGRSL